MTAGPQLHTLHVGDAASAWSRAGFAVAEPTGAAPHSVLLGAVRVLLHGDGGPRGLLRWDLVSHAEGLPTQGTINAADIDGLPTAYVCRNFVCRLPVTDPEALAGQLTAALAGG